MLLDQLSSFNYPVSIVAIRAKFFLVLINFPYHHESAFAQSLITESTSTLNRSPCAVGQANTKGVFRSHPVNAKKP